MLVAYRPCLPTRAAKAPSGKRWVFEVKHDGFRFIARKLDGRVRLYTKQGYDWSQRYPLITEALMRLPAKSVVLDGEATFFDRHGRDNFDLLWNQADDDRVTLCAFDLLELSGEDFRGKPLLDRKRRLAKLLSKGCPGLHLVEHIEGDGHTIFEHACQLKYEGIVCKRIDLPYRPGPSKTWLKIKNRKHPAILRVKEAFEEERRRAVRVV